MDMHEKVRRLPGRPKPRALRRRGRRYWQAVDAAIVTLARGIQAGEIPWPPPRLAD